MNERRASVEAEMLRMLSSWRMSRQEQEGLRPVRRPPTKLSRQSTTDTDSDGEESDNDEDDGVLCINTSWVSSQQHTSISCETVSMSSQLSSLSDLSMELASPAPVIELAPFSFKISIPESGGQDFTPPFHVMESLFRLHIKVDGFDKLVLSLEYLSNTPLSTKLLLVTQLQSSTVCLPAEQTKISITFCTNYNTRCQLTVASLKALNLRFGPRDVDLKLAVSICE
jgi:hypothetical protein